MALSSPESPGPPRRVVINRTENPSEEHEELNKMAHGVVAESRRFVLLVGFFLCSKVSLGCVITGGNFFNLDNLLKF